MCSFWNQNEKVQKYKNMQNKLINYKHTELHVALRKLPESNTEMSDVCSTVPINKRIKGWHL